jgi:uncharacterized membrane protein YphA (DoxX/SURF4 family)
MDKPIFNLLNTSAAAATVVVRLLPGLVFLAEGIKKFMFPTEWGKTTIGLSRRQADASKNTR